MTPERVVALLTVSAAGPDRVVRPLRVMGVVPPVLVTVTVLLPANVVVPPNVSGVLPPNVTVPRLLVRLTALVTVVAMAAWIVPPRRLSAPPPRPVGLPTLSVPDSSVVGPA